MNLLDAKLITTVQGLEIYSDLLENIEIKEIHIPCNNKPFYEIQFGLEYFLLREEKYYDTQRNYFCIRMSHDFRSVTLSETEAESLFAVKMEEEREATKKLLGEWFVNTNNYKTSIIELMNNIKQEDIWTEYDIQSKLETINFLEKLLELTAEDIYNANVEKQEYLQVQ